VYFLGVDIGNTKSHALIADNQGQIVGFGVAGNGNHEVIGVDGFKSVLKNIVYQALDKAGISPTAITGAGFGIAGFDWESDRPLMNEAVDELGMDCPYICVNDAVIGLAAGARAGWGISVSSGTSCNCWGRSLDGREGHVSGNGGNFAEYGGGSEIVMYSIHAISRAWSLRGPQTQLTDFFCQHTGSKDEYYLLEGFARGLFNFVS
jgi:N-acetylglucosamine kinase-like BadF-type ATPase